MMVNMTNANRILLFTSNSAEQFALRPWQLSDAESMARHLGNPKVGQTLADWYPADGYTLALAQHWVSEGHRAFGGQSWAVVNVNDEAVGGSGVHPGAGFARCNAEIGYWLSESIWGQGVGTAVVRALAEQAFAQAEVTRVFAPIHAHNQASQRCCEKNGFVLEGVQRQSVIKSGRAVDVAVWARYRG
jgi:[ribosomal protein S5]-alanine N-acetyltransferase